jgi:hypothetical protein
LESTRQIVGKSIGKAGTIAVLDRIPLGRVADGHSGIGHSGNGSCVPARK